MFGGRREDSAESAPGPYLSSRLEHLGARSHQCFIWEQGARVGHRTWRRCSSPMPGHIQTAQKGASTQLPAAAVTPTCWEERGHGDMYLQQLAVAQGWRWPCQALLPHPSVRYQASAALPLSSPSTDRLRWSLTLC